MKRIQNNPFEVDEITASGPSVKRASRINR